MIGDGNPGPFTKLGGGRRVGLGLRPWNPETITRLLLLRSLWARIRVIEIRFGFSESGQVFGFDLGGLAILAPDGVVNFLTVDGDRFGGGDAESHLVAANIDDGDFDVVADNDRLVLLT